MKIGTSHFVTLAKAVSYYARQNEDAASVAERVRAGEIHIGYPEAGPGQIVTVDHNEGRYFLEDSDVFTREAMMAACGTDQLQAAHRRFYAEVVRESGARVPETTLLRVHQALANGDDNLNTIHLNHWDALAAVYEPGIRAALKRRGDFWSLAGGVCAMKQAARMQAAGEL